MLCYCCSYVVVIMCNHTTRSHTSYYITLYDIVILLLCYLIILLYHPSSVVLLLLLLLLYYYCHNITVITAVTTVTANIISHCIISCHIISYDFMCFYILLCTIFSGAGGNYIIYYYTLYDVTYYYIICNTISLGARGRNVMCLSPETFQQTTTVCVYISIVIVILSYNRVLFFLVIFVSENHNGVYVCPIIICIYYLQHATSSYVFTWKNCSSCDATGGMLPTIHTYDINTM